MSMMQDDGPKAWERQDGEPPRAYHAFCHYRDLQIRAVRTAYHIHRATCQHNPIPEAQKRLPASKRWRQWGHDWGWTERARVWDEEVDRRTREANIASQIEARARHARLAQAMMTVLTVPVRAAINAAQDPQFLKNIEDHARLGPAHALATIREIGRFAAVMPGLVSMERLSLGMSTSQLEVEDHRDDPFAGIADRIIQDKQSTLLAIELLDRVSNLTPTDGHPAVHIAEAFDVAIPAGNGSGGNGSAPHE